MSVGRVLAGVGVVTAVFIGVLVYNWATNRDAGGYLRELHAQITSTQSGLTGLKNEQAALGKTISSAASGLLQRQRSYEARLAAESDEKLKSVWGSYQKGFLVNRLEVLAIGQKLDTMREFTRVLQISAQELETIHGMLSGGGGDVEQRLARLEEQTQTAVEIVAEARNEIAMQRASLKEEQRQIEVLVPAGASQNDPITKELFSALDSALKENRDAQDLLDRLDQIMTSLGKLAFAIRDIEKAESEFHKATRLDITHVTVLRQTD
jgi:biopolymer transport protein ExbB/TolQ